MADSTGRGRQRPKPGAAALPDISSANGYKSKEWGGMFWRIYHHWSRELSRRRCDTGPLLFLLYSPAFMLPCLYCRQSYLSFASAPDRDVAKYLCPAPSPQRGTTGYNWLLERPLLRAGHGVEPPQADRVDSWLEVIHDCVNRKLGKPKATEAERARLYSEDWRPWFWDWLFVFALNFPLHVGRDVRLHDRDVSRRYRTYVLFFESLKDLIPDGTLRQAWTRVYLRHPPSAATFASRTSLVKWLYGIYQLVCQPWKPSSERFESLATVVARYEVLRASSCTDAKAQTCA